MAIGGGGVAVIGGAALSERASEYWCYWSPLRVSWRDMVMIMAM
jgi:hypothetical protein